jgi:hypothetical protein
VHFLAAVDTWCPELERRFEAPFDHPAALELRRPLDRDLDDAQSWEPRGSGDYRRANWRHLTEF